MESAYGYDLNLPPTFGDDLIVPTTSEDDRNVPPVVEEGRDRAGEDRVGDFDLVLLRPH